MLQMIDIVTVRVVVVTAHFIHEYVDIVVNL